MTINCWKFCKWFLGHFGKKILQKTFFIKISPEVLRKIKIWFKNDSWTLKNKLCLRINSFTLSKKPRTPFIIPENAHKLSIHEIEVKSDVAQTETTPRNPRKNLIDSLLNNNSIKLTSKFAFGLIFRLHSPSVWPEKPSANFHTRNVCGFQYFPSVAPPHNSNDTSQSHQFFIWFLVTVYWCKLHSASRWVVAAGRDLHILYRKKRRLMRKSLRKVFDRPENGIPESHVIANDIVDYPMNLDATTQACDVSIIFRER